jgi:hypothetical protein
MNSPLRLRTHTLLVGAAVTMAPVLQACSGGGTTTATDSDTGKSDGNSADAISTDAGKDVANVKRVQKWGVYSLPSGAKARAIAALPGQPGSYLLVGDAGKAWRLDDTLLVDEPIEGIDANLAAAWVSSDGAWFVAGANSTIARHDDKGWVVDQSVAPQTLSFRALGGSSAKDVWAVGKDKAAWRFDGSVWTAQDVSPTAGPSLEGAEFTSVAVAGGEVWLGATLGNGTGALVHGKEQAWQAIATEQGVAALWVSNDGKTVVVAGGQSTNKPFLALVEGNAIKPQEAKLAGGYFTSLAGTTSTAIWAAGTGGSLRAFDGKAWAYENIQHPAGTPIDKQFKATETLLGLAVKTGDERAVLAVDKVYRWGQQPQ